MNLLMNTQAYFEGGVGEWEEGAAVGRHHVNLFGIHPVCVPVLYCSVISWPGLPC